MLGIFTAESSSFIQESKLYNIMCTMTIHNACLEVHTLGIRFLIYNAMAMLHHLQTHLSVIFQKFKSSFTC